jgi:hypothetical protein
VEILHFGWKTVQVEKLINSEKKSVNRGGGPVWYKSKYTPGFLRGNIGKELFLKLPNHYNKVWDDEKHKLREM